MVPKPLPPVFVFAVPKALVPLPNPPVFVLFAPVPKLNPGLFWFAFPNSPPPALLLLAEPNALVPVLALAPKLFVPELPKSPPDWVGCDAAALPNRPPVAAGLEPKRPPPVLEPKALVLVLVWVWPKPPPVEGLLPKRPPPVVFVFELPNADVEGWLLEPKLPKPDPTPNVLLPDAPP